VRPGAEGDGLLVVPAAPALVKLCEDEDYRRALVSADMAIAEADVEEAYIATARALLITGTHLSTEYINRISSLALERARKNDVRTVLDIDYRPVLWGLTKRGDGETRYVRSDNVTARRNRL